MFLQIMVFAQCHAGRAFGLGGRITFPKQYQSYFSQLEFIGKEVAIQKTNKSAMMSTFVHPESEPEGVAAAL